MVRTLFCLGAGKCGTSGHASQHVLQRMLPGWEATAVHNVVEGKRLLRRQRFSVGLISVEDATTVDVDSIASMVALQPSLQWIGIFPPGVSNTSVWRDLIVEHLRDYYTLPVQWDRLAETLGHCHGISMLRQSVANAPPPLGDNLLVGRSRPLLKMIDQLQKVGRVEAPVLITGESGSGKELAAQTIHRVSQRSAGPFIPLNCGAIPSTLIQSELFGYERGAFTGASQAKQGLFEAASGGTLFLDEIADLPLDLQTNLLRFLQERTISRVGSTQTVSLDVRVVAATNVELEEAVATGRFRRDLYYRLNVLSVTVPPLRERREDIALLAQHYFNKYAAEKSERLIGFSSRALFAMEAHTWPGNVRELINRVRRAMVMSEGRLITAVNLELDRAMATAAPEALDDARVTAERAAIVHGLHRAHRNVSKAARELGVSRMTLYRLMAKHEINVSSLRSPR